MILFKDTEDGMRSVGNLVPVRLVLGTLKSGGPGLDMMTLSETSGDSLDMLIYIGTRKANKDYCGLNVELVL